jgi:hypothetical protein
MVMEETDEGEGKNRNLEIVANQFSEKSLCVCMLKKSTDPWGLLHSRMK